MPNPRPSRLVLLLVASLTLVLAGIACSEAEDEPVATATVDATSTAVPTLTPAPTATPLPPPPPRRPEAYPFPPDLQQSTEAILEELTRERNTPLLRPVEMFLLTRDQARAYYGGDRPTPDPGAPTPEPRPRPIDPKQELYQLLGLVQPRADVAQQALDNLISLITGFYSPELDAFYMLDTIGGGLYGYTAQSTIVHELTHAIQDQYYDIVGLVGERADNWDATTALQDLMEGDAINSEIVHFGFSTRSSYRVPQCFQIPARARPNVPYIVERELDTWYEDGLCFVQAVAKQLPDGIAGIWQRIPATTEQILHPEKYLAGEEARPVLLIPLAAALGEGWSEVAANTFGEFTLQNILLAGLPEERAYVQAAAAGWGGDRWALYVAGEARLMQAVLLWDSPEDAREFWQAFEASLYNRGSGRQAPQQENVLSLDLDGVTYRGAIEGDRITLLVANDPAAVERAAGRLGLP